MALRNFTRGLFQLATVSQRRFYPSISREIFVRKPISFLPIRSFTITQSNRNAYQDLNQFLDKEIQLEKSAQQYPSKLPQIPGFEIQNQGPEVTLTRQKGNEKVTVKFNVTNSVNAVESGQDVDLGNSAQQISGNETAPQPGQLKSRPTFTVDINRGGQTLSFLCSYLPQDYSGLSGGENEQQNSNEALAEDFQIDEFSIHDGEWNEKTYSTDCAVVDGELYDKLLDVLEEHGIGEEFANQLADFSTAYEHRQYIDLLEKLKKFASK